MQEQTGDIQRSASHAEERPPSNKRDLSRMRYQGFPHWKVILVD